MACLLGGKHCSYWCLGNTVTGQHFGCWYSRWLGLWLLMTLGVADAALHWRHNDHDGVSNHQPHGCLLNRLFRRRSKKQSKLRVTDLCAGNSPGPVNSPHKGPVTRKMFPFDDVIMGKNCDCRYPGRPLVRIVTVDALLPLKEFPAQRTSYAENVSIWWRHHG